MNCPNCGQTAMAGYDFCLRCGCRFPTGCPNCGELNRTGSLYCRFCGWSLAQGVPAASPLEDLTCPRCDAANERGATFCYACGLPFDEPGGRPASPEIAGAVPSGFWIRLLAWFIDSIALIGAELAVVAALPGISFTRYGDGSEFTWTFNWLSFCLAVVYYTLGVSLFSTTIGKRLLGLYVLRRDGSRIILPRAFCRSLAYIPSFLLLCIGFLMIGISGDKRGLHDRICDTVVVKR